MIRRYAQLVIDGSLRQLARRFPTAFWVGVSKLLRGTEIEYQPPSGSPLAYRGSRLRLIVDSTIFPYTFAKGHWQADNAELVLSALQREMRYVFVDIGANAGLFARQLLIRAPDQITRCVCAEPEVRNFGLLQHNLSPFEDTVTLENVAISTSDGHADLILDPSNVGHHSLVDDRRPGPRQTVSVATMSGEAFSALVLGQAGEARVVLKCDTEGFDEQILASLTDSFWRRVDVCIVELSPGNKPPVDWDRLARVFDQFEQMFWTDQPEEPVVMANLRSFASRESGHGRDVMMVRRRTSCMTVRKGSG
jgi:FkbM family methyltransferase